MFQLDWKIDCLSTATVLTKWSRDEGHSIDILGFLELLHDFPHVSSLARSLHHINARIVELARMVVGSYRDLARMANIVQLLFDSVLKEYNENSLNFRLAVHRF